VMDGSAGEMFAPPFGDGPGDHLAWYYPVVFSKKLVIGIDGLGPLEYYYAQADAVLDVEPLERKPAPSRLDARDTAIEVLSSTEKGAGPRDELLAPTPITVAAGAPTTLAELTGPATIFSFSLQLAADARAALENVFITATWDDAAEPAINLPLSDLFAAALDAPENSSLGLSGATENGKLPMELRLPMPFSSKAKFVAMTALPSPIDLVVTAEGEKKLPDGDWGKLYAQRKETLSPAPGETHKLASVNGRGRWAGTCAMLEGHGINDGSLFDEPFNFLEGDETAVLDGALKVRGTGTEDYFNGAFYFESGAHASPFAQWWGAVVTAPKARASACRFHLLGDTIDFQESAEMDLEIGPGLPETLDRYRTVAFFYQ